MTRNGERAVEMLLLIGALVLGLLSSGNFADESAAPALTPPFTQNAVRMGPEAIRAPDALPTDGDWGHQIAKSLRAVSELLAESTVRSC